jgi:GntR family transcriptional regulator
LQKFKDSRDVDALDKKGFIPLYYQIQQSLLARIHQGDLKEGDLFESEEELSRRYKLSRMTARQALHGLKLQGYALSERGRGTFVTRPKLVKSILLLESFTEEIRRKGIKPSSRLLEQRVMRPTPELAERLNLQPSADVLHLRRVRLADDIPLALEDSHVPLKRFPGLEEIDFSTKSLYETMRHRYGVQPAWADETIEALPATREEAALLTIARSASLLCISRTLMGPDHAPLEFAVSRYRGDRYRAWLRVPMLTFE